MTGISDWPQATWWRPACRTAAILAPLLTCAILATFRDSVTAATAVLVLVLWVVAAAATGDRAAGILAAVSGGVWFDFFLTEPYLRLTIHGSDDVEATLLLVLISLAVTEIACGATASSSRPRGARATSTASSARLGRSPRATPPHRWSSTWSPARSPRCSEPTTAARSTAPSTTRGWRCSTTTAS